MNLQTKSGYYSYIHQTEITLEDSPLVNQIQKCQNKCSKTHNYRKEHICPEK